MIVVTVSKHPAVMWYIPINSVVGMTPSDQSNFVYSLKKFCNYCLQCLTSLNIFYPDKLTQNNVISRHKT